MRFFAIFLTVIISLNAFAAAPLGFQGQQDTSSKYPYQVQTPNKLLTDLGGGKALIENGNSNILANPSFEAPTVSAIAPSWNNVPGNTVSEETTNVVHGKKSIFISAGGLTLDLNQDSTLYQSQFADGIQGLAYMRVKLNFSSSPLYVCPRKAGAYPSQMTSGCVQVQANNKWGLYKVPFVLGGTSNGIGLTSNGVSISTSGLYIDDAFVGAVDLKQDTPSVYTQSSKWAAGSTTTGQVFSGTATTDGSGNFTISSGVVTALRDINLTMSCSGTSSGSFTITVSITAAGASGPIDNTVVGTGNTASTSWSGKLTSGQTASCSNTSANTASSGYVTVSATNIVNSSVYTSQNADTDPVPCQFSTLAWQGLGTVTSNLLCQRKGNELKMYGRVAIGTTAAAEAQIPLPLWNGQSLNISSQLTGLTNKGTYARSASSTSHGGLILATPSLGYVQMSDANNFSGSASQSLATATGSNVASTGETIGIDVTVPISQWINSNIMIAQINGLESCADTLSCTETLVATISTTGAVSKTNVSGWVTSGAGSTGVYALTIPSTIFPNSLPNCSCNNLSGNTRGCAISIASSTSIQVTTYANGSTPANADFDLRCTRTGVDAVFKTARAVASDQNVRTPGVTKAVTVWAKFTSAGALSFQSGSTFQACSLTSGLYTCPFAASSWTGNPPICHATPDGSASAVDVMVSHGNTATTTSNVYWKFYDSLGNNKTDQAFEVVCHGQAP